MSNINSNIKEGEEEKKHGSLKKAIEAWTVKLNSKTYKDRIYEQYKNMNGEYPTWDWNKVKSETINHLYKGGEEYEIENQMSSYGLHDSYTGKIKINEMKVGGKHSHYGHEQTEEHEVGHRVNAYRGSNDELSSRKEELAGSYDYDEREYLEGFMKYGYWSSMENKEVPIKLSSYELKPYEGHSFKHNIENSFKNLNVWDANKEKFNESHLNKIMDLDWDKFYDEMSGKQSNYLKGIGLYEMMRVKKRINGMKDGSGRDREQDKLDNMLGDKDRKNNIIKFMNEWSINDNVEEEKEDNNKDNNKDKTMYNILRNRNKNNKSV